jgi:Outer membrane protein/protective antigen OMA87
MKKLLLSTLVTVLFFSGTPAWAKKSLDISTLSPTIQEEILKRYPTVKSEKLSLSEVDEIIRFLQLKPQFDRIKVIDDNSPSYKLEFSQTRRVGEVEINGVKGISESEARSIFDVKTGDPFSQQDLIDDAEKLRLLYKEKGFFNAIIDIEMPPGENETINVVVKVTENKRTAIRNIKLSSPNQELNRELAKELEDLLDEPLTDPNLATVQKTARKFLSKNRFLRTDLVGPTIEYSSDESEATLNYRLERSEKYFIEYSGVRLLDQGSIADAMDLDNFYSSNPVIGTELASRIKNYYLSRGYARVEVAAQEVEAGPLAKRVLLTIQEGPRVKIQKIVINGHFSRDEKDYVKLIESFSSSTVRKGYYNKEDLDTGVKNLVVELQNEGYLLAKVASTRTQYNKEKDAVTFFVNLEEGPMTKIQDMLFSGNTAIPTEKLVSVTKLKLGEALKLNEIEAAIANLKNFYREQGYIEMYLLNEKEDLVTYDETNTLAKLNFRIYEGPQVKVASIVLEGNDFTKDYILYKELEFENGDLVTPSKLQESVARLQRTGYFNSVEIKTLEEKTAVANRTVVVKVTEREPGLFTLGAGATNERTLTLRGYAGVAYRNLFGTGRGISLRLEGNYNIADVKYPERKIVFGYLEPYLFDTRVRGRVNITRSNLVTDYDLHKITEIQSITYSLEKDFTSHILGVWDIWSLAFVRDTGFDNVYPYPTEDLSIATTGPTVDIDFRDNPFNPTRGTFTRINAEYASPRLGSSDTIEYVRTTASFTYYWMMDKWIDQPVVWANQIRGGYLKNLNDEPDGGVPWDKKGFTLGGRSTIRGYEAGTSEVFPNDTDLGMDKTQYKMTTESTMGLIKSEIRFPVYGSFGGAVFYDGGYVTIQDLKFEDNYRDSVGFGLHYNTPVGPLNLEWAWKLDRKEGEEPWRFHLSIGNF